MPLVREQRFPYRLKQEFFRHPLLMSDLQPAIEEWESRYHCRTRWRTYCLRFVGCSQSPRKNSVGV